MNQQASAPGMSQPTSRGDQADVTAITPKADNDNICAHCRDIPWIDGPLEEETMLIKWLASEKCSVCCLLLRCEPEYDKVAMLWWMRDRARNFQSKSILGPKCEQTVSPFMLSLHSIRNGRILKHTINICSTNIEAARNRYQHLDLPEAKVSFSQIRKNISFCIEHHQSSCDSMIGRKLIDLRVIDCETRCLTNVSTNCNYVALSYVWGKQLGPDDFDLSHSLPSTIEHAISATLELGYQYLWVDRYCIDQYNIKDRDTQILQMNLIYQKAQLTIIAAAGDNPSYGLPGVRNCRKFRSPVRHAQIGTLCLSSVPSDMTLANTCLDEIAGSKWASRAWTYQEAAFSQRRLLFTDREVLFSCNAMTCFETGSTLRNQDLSSLKALWDYRASTSEEEVVRRITLSMEQYCGRYLTKDSDALNAILSTLEILVERDYYHLWGIPVRCYGLNATDQKTSQPEMPCSPNSPDLGGLQMVDIWLSWRHDESWRRERCPRRRLGFPSWSPLGWAEEPIKYKHNSSFTGVVSLRTPFTIKPLSDYLQSVDSNPHNMPQLLYLRSKTAQVQLLNGENTPSLPGEDGRILFSLGERYHITHSVCWDIDPTMYSGPVKAVIISDNILEVDFLLLKDFTSHYERIGSGSLLKASLNSVFPSRCLWHEQDDFSFLAIYMGTVDGTTHEERLTAFFGDLDMYEWWNDIFKEEEYITLG